MPEMSIGEIREHTKRYTKELIPNTLPNNIKIWREQLHKIPVKQLADELLIDRNFLTAVEAQDKNFSGKTTIRYIKHFSSKNKKKSHMNFYAMYDVQKKCICDTTDEKFYISDCVFTISMKEVHELYEKEKKKKKEDPSIDDLIEYISARNPVIEKHLAQKADELEAKFKEEDKDIIDTEKLSVEFNEYRVVKSKVEDGNMVLNLEAIFKKEFEVKDHEFDINFARDEDKELTKMMIHMGYGEEIAALEYDVDNEFISVVNGKVILSKEYKIPNGRDVSDFYLTDTLDINQKEGDVEIKRAADGTPKKVKFKAVRPSINNFKRYRTLNNKTIEEMATSVGLTYNGYLNLEMGAQKISTKIMWGTCKSLRIPLETILNIDEYYERYCRHTKIRKRSSHEEE